MIKLNGVFNVQRCKNQNLLGCSLNNLYCFATDNL